MALAAGLPTFRRLEATGDSVALVDVWLATVLDLAKDRGCVFDPSQGDTIRTPRRALNDAALAACDWNCRSTQPCPICASTRTNSARSTMATC